jgi:hypothetical protein
MDPENGKDLQILFKPLIDLPVGDVLHYKNGDFGEVYSVYHIKLLSVSKQ